MRVSQRFIDLLNVPLLQLRFAAEAAEIANAKSQSKWELAERLAQTPRERLEELAGGYLYAGRTSLSFFRLDDPPDEGADELDEAEAPMLRGAALDARAVLEVLNDLKEGGDAFSEVARPRQVTRDPQLVVARQRDDGSILMSFAVEKRVGHVIHDFEMQSVYADDFFNAVLYPADGLIELRTNQQVAHKFARSWLTDFVDRFEDLAFYPVSITLDDIQALKTELQGELFRYRGKKTYGTSIDTIEVKALPNVDLDGQDEFVVATDGLDQQLGDLRFFHEEREYSIRVSRLQGSIYFVTPAPEETIDYVREMLRRVKARHLVP